MIHLKFAIEKKKDAFKMENELLKGKGFILTNRTKWFLNILRSLI